ncbi:unnamed protein product [Sympodiomycopsis kandeliae]
MDFLKAEIAKKRKAEDSRSPPPPASDSTDKGEGTSTSPPPPNKYVRRGDLEKQKEADAAREREARRREKERLRQLKEEARSNRSSKSATPERAGSVDDSGFKAAEAAILDARKETFNISPQEAARRLRAKGEPVRLFGETEKETRLRLRALELIEARGEKSGQNDFMRALAGAESGISLEQLERERMNREKEKESAQEKRSEDDSNKEGESSSNTEKKSRRQGQGIGMDSLLDLDLIRKDMNKVYPIIYYTLKGLLEDWGKSLSERPIEVKMSTSGKTASAIQVQSSDYLKPLFKSLRKRELPPDVLMRIAEIVHFMQKREYRNANDSYLQLSIGNAPWPIGVTMVGIHERSGREKIFASNVAHVLNDEVSRKYIQSLKRLMTFAQTQFPPSDISMLMG